MNSFLNKIAQLDSIREVILLSLQGGLLFYRQVGISVIIGGEIDRWNEIINDLGRPPTADFVFSEGRYYLHSTDVGYLIVGMTNDKSLKKIRVACENVQEKLVDSNVRKKVLLKMLAEGEEMTKPHLVNALNTLAEAEISQVQNRSVKVQPLADGSNPEDQQVKELLDKGQKGQAISLIMQLIEDNAKAKCFHRAEDLRNRLMQIDSMALLESIRAAEIIEEEKSASISNEYLLIWKELVNTLSPEEFASLYHAMTEKNYADGEMVVNQGEFHSTLFFVNSGRIQISAVSQGREVPIKVVGPGEILGGDTFFDVSVWTVNVVSKGASLSLLTWERLQSQKENCPALHSKLQDFCARFTSPSKYFSKSSRTRRQFERKKAVGRVTIDLLDQHGRETGLAARGELLDLSRGGVALTLRFSKKKSAAALLGKKIRVNIRPDVASVVLLRIGKVMAVRCHDFIGNDYSLHIEFDSELSSAEIQQVVGKDR
jgi:CRP-like cAMP-binding protein